MIKTVRSLCATVGLAFLVAGSLAACGGANPDATQSRPGAQSAADAPPTTMAQPNAVSAAVAIRGATPAEHDAVMETLASFNDAHLRSISMSSTPPAGASNTSTNHRWMTLTLAPDVTGNDVRAWWDAYEFVASFLDSQAAAKYSLNLAGYEILSSTEPLNDGGLEVTPLGDNAVKHEDCAATTISVTDALTGAQLRDVVAKPAGPGVDALIISGEVADAQTLASRISDVYSSLTATTSNCSYFLSVADATGRTIYAQGFVPALQAGLSWAPVEYQGLFFSGGGAHVPENDGIATSLR